MKNLALAFCLFSMWQPNAQSFARSTLIQDDFLLKGDDLIHINVGLTPTYFFSRDFALQLKFQYQKMGLVDADLSQLMSANLGIFFIIPALKP